jgi:hypothetical protein
MKHLKSFNESSFLSEDLNELQSFCETYLAYLIDEGFGIRVRHGSRKDRARIEFYKDDVHFPAPFNWDDVKDHYIPFYQMLSKEYEISTMVDRTLVDCKVKYGAPDYKYEVRDCSVKFEYRKPAKQLWETDAKWFTEQEIINDEVGDLGSYVGVISIFLDKN